LDKTIEGYLVQLRGALAGADPALAQDALYDAEEYLRSAAAEAGGTPEAVEAAIDAYGTPEEIALAYRDAEITVAAALRAPRPMRSDNPFARFFGIIADPQAWGSLFYMVLALATGIVYFTVVVTGLSLSFGLAVLIVGAPIALLFLAIVRAISMAEGRMVEGLLGERMPRRPRTVGAQGNLWERIKSWLADYRTWTTMLYMLLQMPLGILYFTLLVTAIATSAGLIALPIVQDVSSIPMLVWDGYSHEILPWAQPLVIALGVIGFFVTLWAAKGIGRLHAAWAKVMLVGRFEGTSTAAEGAVIEGDAS
jgi:hypothetical protein